MRDIARYISTDNPEAAASVIARLRATGTALGETSTGRPGRVAGTLEKSVTRLPYILAYAVGADQVTVLAVIHTARNWPPDKWPSS